jgi:hypothetical protein
LNIEHLLFLVAGRKALLSVSPFPIAVVLIDSLVTSSFLQRNDDLNNSTDRSTGRTMNAIPRTAKRSASARHKADTVMVLPDSHGESPDTAIATARDLVPLRRYDLL